MPYAFALQLQDNAIRLRKKSLFPLLPVKVTTAYCGDESTMKGLVIG